MVRFPWSGYCVACVVYEEVAFREAAKSGYSDVQQITWREPPLSADNVIACGSMRFSVVPPASRQKRKRLYLDSVDENVRKISLLRFDGKALSQASV